MINIMPAPSDTVDRRAMLRRKIERQQKFIVYRVRVLPGQIEAARRKLAALENEARRLGMHDLLEKENG